MEFLFSGSGLYHTEAFNGCSSPGDRKVVYLASSENTPRGIRLVRVCTRNNNKKRMKGIRIRGAAISSSGAQRDPGLIDEEDRPNCNKNWSPRISQCPNGQVATRVRVEYNHDPYPVKSVVGMNIYCSRARTAN